MGTMKLVRDYTQEEAKAVTGVTRAINDAEISVWGGMTWAGG